MARQQRLDFTIRHHHHLILLAKVLHHFEETIMSAGSVRLLHVGFMVPLDELLSDNEALERELGFLNLRSKVYSAVHFYKDTNQDTMRGWFDQRKRASRNGYLRACYVNKRGDGIVEMDVDGKQFYLIASASTSKPPIQMKQDVSKGLFGERKAFADRIEVPCFAYKCEAEGGFIESEAFATFKEEHDQKKTA